MRTTDELKDGDSHVVGTTEYAQAVCLDCDWHQLDDAHEAEEHVEEEPQHRVVVTEVVQWKRQVWRDDQGYVDE